MMPEKATQRHTRSSTIDTDEELDVLTYSPEYRRRSDEIPPASSIDAFSRDFQKRNKWYKNNLCRCYVLFVLLAALITFAYHSTFGTEELALQAKQVKIKDFVVTFIPQSWPWYKDADIDDSDVVNGADTDLTQDTKTDESELPTIEEPEQEEQIWDGGPIDPTEQLKEDDISNLPPWRLRIKNGKGMPRCEKVFLYTFTGKMGFASNWLLYMRTRLLAEKMGYTVLENDQWWNQGRLTNYFEQRVIDCVPSDDWSNRTAGVRFGDGFFWADADRLRADRSEVKVTDGLLYEEYILAGGLAELKELYESVEREKRKKERTSWRSEDALPPAFYEAFKVQAKLVETMWKPNHLVRELITEIKRETGVGDQVKPFIGTHIRSGDIAGTFNNHAKAVGLFNSANNYSMHLEAAQQRKFVFLGPTPEKRVAEASRHVQPVWDRLKVGADYPPSSNSNAYAADVRPTLGIMTAEADMATKLKASFPESSSFDVINLRQSPAPPHFKTTYIQKLWDRWPAEYRIKHTRLMVAELTLLAKEADGFVVTGASYLGQLAMLLAGFDDVVGPMDSEGKFVGGRVRPVDMFWYPMSQIASLWRDVS